MRNQIHVSLCSFVTCNLPCTQNPIPTMKVIILRDREVGVPTHWVLARNPKHPLTLHAKPPSFFSRRCPSTSQARASSTSHRATSFRSPFSVFLFLLLSLAVFLSLAVSALLSVSLSRPLHPSSSLPTLPLVFPGPKQLCAGGTVGTVILGVIAGFRWLFHVPYRRRGFRV